MLAQQLEVDAARLFACFTVFARPVAQAGIHDYRLTCSHRTDARADDVDNPRRVRSHYPIRGNLHSREAGKHEEIEVVQRRGGDTYPHLPRARLGDRQIGAVLELVESAIGGDG